jgi:hypothetical protein
MNKLGIVCVLVVASGSVFGQASVRDLSPTHAAALETYLSQNKTNTFRAESILDDDYLKYMRESLGAKLTPNYVVGDFNGDRIKDFAVLLNRAGTPTNLPTSPSSSKEHFPDHPLTLVVFNGMKGGRFRVAFTRNLDGPKAAFISMTTARRKRLYYGVFETDSDMFTLVPSGRGYVAR